MGMNVSTSMSFENRDLISSTTRNLPKSNDVVAEKVTGNVFQQNTGYANEKALTTQQYILMASTQITVNNSLKETLKYLRAHEDYKKKEHSFGDLWQILNAENEDSEKNPYKEELLDIDIENKKNIFAA